MIRIRYKILGGHVHCRVFTGLEHGHTFAKCGDLVFTLEEWKAKVQADLGNIADVLPEEPMAEMDKQSLTRLRRQPPQFDKTDETQERT
jgi:hypothetical protein